MRLLPLLLYTCVLTAQSRKETVVVTGTLDPLPFEESERVIALLPLRANNLLFNTFMDALRLDPSVDIRQRAPNGIQADVSIRGATFGQTLVLWNGRRMSDGQSAHHNMDFPAPLEAIERIEVLHGAGSSLYGSDAVGGVINFITSAPETTEIRLQAAIGNFGVNQQRLAAAGIKGRFSQQVSFSRDFSTGFIPNRDYRNISANSTTRWSSALGFTDLDLGYSDKPFGAQGFYGNYPSWERTKTWFAGIRQALGERTEIAMTYRRHTDLFVLYRDQPQRYMNHHTSESWQGSLRRRESLGQNVRLFYGGEGFGDAIVSNNLGTHDRARAAAYASLDARVLKRWSMTAGVRTEVFKGLPGQWSPSLGVGYWASSILKFRGSVSRAFRLPTYTDLFYRDPANIGNALLRAEKAWSYEAGADLHPAAAWRLQTTIFHRRDTDGIDFVRPIGTLVWNAVNVQKLRFTGFETSAAWKLRDGLFDWSYAGLSASAFQLTGMQSKYAFNYLVHSGLFGWTGTIRGKIVARTRIGAAERKAYKAYAAWDISLARAVGSLRPYVQFTNLTNSYTEDIPGVANPGRAIIAGVQYIYRK